nr:DUF2917 domain-containing protein [Dechloromonas sp.]
MLTYARFLLYPGEMLRLDGSTPVTLYCEQGSLWVTAGREGIDHALAGGERFVCPAGTILIEGSGTLLVMAKRQPRLAAVWQRGLPFRNMALLSPATAQAAA